MAFEGGEGFDPAAKRAEETLKNKDLNPKLNKVGWKTKAGLALAGIATMLGGSAAVENKYGDDVRNKVSDAADLVQNKKEGIEVTIQGPEDFTKPTTNETVTVNLQSITNDQGENLAPTFRSEAKAAAEELTSDELRQRGVDISSGTAKIREVKGATYPSQLKAGDMTDEATGEHYGIWGEVVVTDPNTGEDTPTGIYLSKNFYTPQEATSNAPQEGK